MMKDSQSRKYFCTINHPLERGLTPEVIKEKMSKFRSLIYYCFAYECGAENQTEHCHLYCQFSGGVRFSTIQKTFDCANIQTAHGTAEQCRSYIQKSGRWSNSDKAKTKSAEDSFFEYGTLKQERQGKRSDLDLLYQQIKDNLSDFQIVDGNPRFLRYLPLIEKTRIAIAKELAAGEYTPTRVIFLWGEHGVGKTRYVLDNYDSLFRVTRYKNPFDNYAGQSTVFLDSYYNGLTLEDLLLYTEGYKTEISCRYYNKFSNWDTIIIASTKSITDLQRDEQFSDPGAWKAFLRRLTDIIHFLPSGEKFHYKVDADYNIVPVNLDTAPDFPSRTSTS